MGFLQLSKFVTGVLVAITAWLLAPLVWQISALLMADDAPVPPFNLTSAPISAVPADHHDERLRMITDHHLFGQSAQETNKRPSAPVINDKTVKKTRLNITLLGLVAGQHGVAVINFEGRQGAYRVDEVIVDKHNRRVTLAAIASDHVIIYNNDVAEKLLLPKPKHRTISVPHARAEPTLVSLSDPAFTELLGDNAKRTLTTNPLALTRFLSLAPQRQGGYRIQAGRDTRLLDRAGLHSGDVITHINNIPAANLDIAQLYQIISNTAAVSLILQRNGQPVQMDIRL